MGYYKVVEYCTKLTAKSLTFSDHCDEVTFVKPSAAHCVGYARTLATLCNYAFKVNHIDAKATPVVGYVKVGGVNVCHLLSTLPYSSVRWSNFTKDHDFVRIKCPDGDYEYYDALAYDVLGNDLKTIN